MVDRWGKENKFQFCDYRSLVMEDWNIREIFYTKMCLYFPTLHCDEHLLRVDMSLALEKRKNDDID